ncbi:uncharacterized protein CEXT_334681 [Caerostris extrusa]|uniref:HAT C-terminal dimerisation domain-containing protein n=1 Tax=Caerostris extrusa TaxID=172846 RepID=A0AAV4VX98_CAEEX|nr:uncharacterized protein CEXT_334681 [Caerostris extrusa]
MYSNCFDINKWSAKRFNQRFNAVSKQCTIPVIFLLLFIPWRPCKKSNCDLEHCSSIFQTASKDIFRRDTNHLCGSSADISECVSNCFEIFFPDFMLINSGTSIVKEICNDEFIYDLSFHWGCISKYFHRLLACVSMSASMISVNTSNTSREFSCKKALKILDCPHDILQDCDIEAIMIVSELFKHIFKTFMTKACFKVSSGYAYDLPAKYIF